MEYKLTPAMRAEVRKMDKYSNEIRLLNKYNITNSDELYSCKTNLNGQLNDLIRQRNMRNKRRKSRNVLVKSIKIFIDRVYSMRKSFLLRIRIYIDL